MNNSPTGTNSEDTGLSNEPTGASQEQVTAEQTQDTSSGANTQESVSDDTADQNQNQNDDGEQKQTKQTGGESKTDDGLAKFAKSQGVEDVSALSENELRFLKIAHDNQKAFREKGQNQASVSDTAKELGNNDAEARIAALEYERTTDKFWSGEGRDKSLEPAMTEILYDKVEQLKPTLGEEGAREYAFNLSRDLDTLYAMAQIKSGAVGSTVDTDAIRREERESIRKQSMAGAGNAHAVTQQRETAKIDANWVRNEYNSKNPEHVKMLDEYMSQNK